MAHPLREAVKSRFYPFAEARGYVRVKSGNPLFAEFRREIDGMVHEFDIQWDKCHHPKFVLNMRMHGSPESAATSRCCRLQRKRGPWLGCWFQLRKPWLEVIRSGSLRYTPDEVVDQLIALFPEVEECWASGVEGPHLNCH